MAVIFQRVGAVGWGFSGWAALVDAPGLVAFTVKTKSQARGWEEDWFLSRCFWSIKLYPSLSLLMRPPPLPPPLKTPASLRDIRWTHWVDKTQGLTASLGPCILLTPIAPAWVPQPNDCLCSDVHYCFRSAPCPPAVKENGNAMTGKVGGGEAEIILEKCKQTPLRRNIQFAAAEDVTQGAQLYQRTLALLCCS